MYIYARILEISKRRYRIFNRIFHFAACTRLQLAATGSNRVNNKVERENKIIRGEMISKNNPRKSFFFFLNDLSLSFFHEIYGNNNIGVNPPSFDFHRSKLQSFYRSKTNNPFLINSPLARPKPRRNHKIANRATRWLRATRNAILLASPL